MPENPDWPDRKTERRILEELQSQLEDPVAAMAKFRRLRRIVHGIGYTLLLAAFLMAFAVGVPPLFTAFTAAFGGAAIGFALSLVHGLQHSACTQPHVDRDSLAQRRRVPIGRLPGGQVHRAAGRGCSRESA